MPRGYWVDYTALHPYGYEYQARRWVEDPNGPEWRDPPLVQFLKAYSCCWGICLILLIVIIGVFGGGSWIHDWIHDNIAAPNEFGVDTSWQGQEYQYDNIVLHTTDMSLTVDSVKNGAFTATVQWPVMNTITYASGVIVTNISDKRWKYVTHPAGTHLQFTECSKGAVYLQFTETAYIKGKSVILNVSYYGIACGSEISGVWFWPNKPHDGPGGEFTLSKQ